MIALQNPNNNGKWHCTRCNTWNEDAKTRCGWCSLSKEEAAKQASQVPDPEARLTTQIHQAIDKLNGPAKRRLWAWLEDTLL